MKQKSLLLSAVLLAGVFGANEVQASNRRVYNFNDFRQDDSSDQRLNQESQGNYLAFLDKGPVKAAGGAVGIRLCTAVASKIGGYQREQCEKGGLLLIGLNALYWQKQNLFSSKGVLELIGNVMGTLGGYLGTFLIKKSKVKGEGQLDNTKDQ